jgi:hypothetical protein
MMADPKPTSDARVVRVFADPELGREAFTYELSTGDEGSIHLDSVLEYNEDPAYLADIYLYRLTVEARKRLEESGIPVREVTRALGTSASQLYRLLDTTNTAKSVRQLLSLLSFLGYDVEFSFKKRIGGPNQSRSRVPGTDAARRSSTARKGVQSRASAKKLSAKAVPAKQSIHRTRQPVKSA